MKSARSAFMPLLLLWLAVHAALLALILGAKFLFTKTVFLTVLVAGALAATWVFLFARTTPRRLSHGP